MSCFCYYNRESQKKDNKKKLYNDLWKKIDDNQYPILGNKMDNTCSYILCEKIVKSESKKNALLGNTCYTFCTDECWSNWLSSGPNLTHSAKSSPITPEYLRSYKNSTKIPPLFI